MLDKAIKILAAAVLLVSMDMIFECHFPVVREISFNTGMLEKGKEISLLHISDFHGSSSRKLMHRLVAEAERVKPQAIVITGDLVDSSTKDFSNVYALIKGLHAVCPNIYFVSGNHEWSNGKKQELLEGLQAMGVTVLNNKSRTFTAGGSDINICGVDDPYRHRDKIEKSMLGIANKKYTILLSHSPRIRDRLGNYTPDLILCGHTHGGQVRLPFIGAVIAPGEGLLPKFDKGAFVLENGSTLYIDSGAGTSELPIRLLNRSQMSLIRIKGQ